MIVLTPGAIAHVKNALRENGHDVFKLSLAPKGCSGLAYVMSTALGPVAGAVTVVAGGVSIAIPEADYDKLSEIELDWVKDGFGHRLSVSNPRVMNACGCGASFMFK